MQIVKNALAGFAAVGLLASHPAAAAQAANTRHDATSVDGEGLADGSAPVVVLISLLALAALIAIVVGDDNDAPTSP